MQPIKVKICGMTRPQDVAMAVAQGVDAVGMILHATSPRLIDKEQARKIRAVVPEQVKLVGVFVDAPAELVANYTQDIGLDVVQLHGDETRDFADSLALPYIKAIRAKDSDQVAQQVKQFASACAILLDPYVPGQHGGTGKQLDLSLWPKTTDHKLVLAGGLNPNNIRQTVLASRPYAVDLNSGVEIEPGVKDIRLIRQALHALDRLHTTV